MPAFGVIREDQLKRVLSDNLQEPGLRKESARAMRLYKEKAAVSA